MLTTTKGTVSPLRIGKGPQVRRAGINTSSRIGSTERERQKQRERKRDRERDREPSETVNFLYGRGKKKTATVRYALGNNTMVNRGIPSKPER